MLSPNQVERKEGRLRQFLSIFESGRNETKELIYFNILKCECLLAELRFSSGK